MSLEFPLLFSPDASTSSFRNRSASYLLKSTDPTTRLSLEFWKLSGLGEVSSGAHRLFNKSFMVTHVSHKFGVETNDRPHSIGDGRR